LRKEINCCFPPEKQKKQHCNIFKKGGRVAISDLALLKPLPREVAEMVVALVGCVAGAILVSDIERITKDVGLVDVRLKSKPGYIDAMTSWQDPLYQKILAALPEGAKASDYITSLDISAMKKQETARE
jgi:hypothetical protein